MSCKDEPSHEWGVATLKFGQEKKTHSIFKAGEKLGGEEIDAFCDFISSHF